ncbi:MAG TPA: hypothetical protein VLW47_05375 [Thermodesulfobacteriota bacterium]|nr:hypothetical protein [Thermodesulfobacteriota bacterium]
MGRLFTLPLFFYSVRLVRTDKGGKEEGTQKDVRTALQEIAFKKCPSRAFIMLKFLEVEKVMNKKVI